MKSPRAICWLLLVLLCVWGSQVLAAQDEVTGVNTVEDVAVGDPDGDMEEAEVTRPAAPIDVKEMVEGLLEEDEDVFAGRGYGYDPAGRRDPFRSLLKGRDDGSTDRGPRPEGIAGLAVNEIDLTGIFELPEGPVAQVQTSDRDRSYLLRAGDKLYDGDVVSVSANEVVFRQILDDPTALTPFREVVKRLNP
jgi:hypothetical protein